MMASRGQTNVSNFSTNVSNVGGSSSRQFPNSQPFESNSSALMMTADVAPASAELSPRPHSDVAEIQAQVSSTVDLAPHPEESTATEQKGAPTKNLTTACDDDITPQIQKNDTEKQQDFRA